MIDNDCDRLTLQNDLDQIEGSNSMELDHSKSNLVRFSCRNLVSPQNYYINKNIINESKLYKYLGIPNYKIPNELIAFFIKCFLSRCINLFIPSFFSRPI